MSSSNQVTAEYPQLPADLHTRLKHRDAKGRFVEGEEGTSHDHARSADPGTGDAPDAAADKKALRGAHSDPGNKQHRAIAGGPLSR